LLLIDAFSKGFHGVLEATIFHRDDQINGVEVLFAIKTSCQVGLVICGGMKVVAQRASEPEYLVVVSQLKV
jgi:hypothetical protein